MIRVSLWGAVLMLAVGCGGGSAPAITPATAVGNWEGTWNNTTFSSSGAAKATITNDEATKKVTFVLDLDGNVFGGTDPAAETFTGTADGTKYTVTGASKMFGMLSLTVDTTGKISGSASPTRGAVTFDGTASQTEMKLNYTLKDSTGDVKGTLTITKKK